MMGISIILIAVALVLFLILNAKPKTYKEITFSNLQELIKSEEKFILFIGSNSCSHCTIFKVTVNDVVADYHIIINYIDVSKLTDTQYAYLNAHLSFSGTPTTVLVDSGSNAVEDRVLTKIKGSKGYDEFTKSLEKYGFIEK